MAWFFDQVYRSSNVFDYAIGSFESAPVVIRGFTDDAEAEPQFTESRSPGTYRTTVVVRRLGEAVFPVDVLVTFEDGHEVRESWDGLERWKAYTYDWPARATTAQVDPDRVLLLDVNYTNNSRTLEPEAEAAATKWSLKWMVWLQDLMLTWGLFV